MRKPPESLRALGVLRARQWLHFAPLPLVGLEVRGAGALHALARGALGVGAACLVLGYAYGINALADRASDVSSAKNPLAGARAVPPSAKLVVAAAGAGALLAGLALGSGAPWLVAASLAAGTVYSAGPRLKALPVLGTLVNTAIFAPLLGFAAAEGAAAPPAAAVLSATFVGVLFQSQLLHEAADAAEDAAGGVLTTARWLGPERTRVLVAGLAFPFIALAALLAPGPLTGFAAAGVLALGAAAALVERDWAAARRLHRRLALAGGAVLFAAGYWP